jgi:uncharacterized membrane protein
MKMHRSYVISIVILVIQLAIVLWLGYSLPEDTQLPIHWNIHNQIDNFAPRNTAIIPFWLFNLGLFLLMMFSSKLSPVVKQNKERYDVMIPTMTLGLVFFFALFHIYILLLGHYPQWQEHSSGIYVLIGLLFVFLGNILPKVPRNYIAGIKTPWTFNSDVIWRKTSRLGGYCFFLLGLLMLIKGVLHTNAVLLNWLLVIMLAVSVLIPMIYAFYLYKRGTTEDKG